MHAIRCNPVLLGAGEHTYLNCLAFPVCLNPLVEDLSYLSLCIPANASRTGGVPTLRENLRCNILHPDPDRPPLRNLHPSVFYADFSFSSVKEQRNKPAVTHQRPGVGLACD